MYRPVTAVGVSLWSELDRAQKNGNSVILEPDQIRALLADNARLIEAKNEVVRELYGTKPEEV